MKGHKFYTHTPKSVYEEGDVTVLWNQTVHTDREVTANRPDIIIKNKKRESMHANRCSRYPQTEMSCKMKRKKKKNK
jgi:hypothetical protein